MSFFQQSLDFDSEPKPVVPRGRSSGTRAQPEAGDDETIPPVWTVADLTRRIRELLEGALGEVWVEGEITNHRRQASGHHYFSLKDETAQLSCVLFRGSAATHRGLELTDGVQVRLFGELSVYEARGQYQLIVRKVEPRGEGALRARFEALKARLKDEGLFDSDRKRGLPRFPRRIGLVTSPTGAAIRDFLRTLVPRWGAEVLLRPVRVQGSGAAAEIAEALDAFSEPREPSLEVDLIVLIRGGGSLEDLWEFNEEAVARAIARAKVPVVTGIGHEVDFTIADFVADYRAATPTAAAAAVAPERREIEQSLGLQLRRVQRGLGNRLAMLRLTVARLAEAGVFREPRRVIETSRLTIDRSLERLGGAVRTDLKGRRHAVAQLAQRLKTFHPDTQFLLLRERLRHLRSRLLGGGAEQLRTRRQGVERFRSALRAYSPEGTLRRGYAIPLRKSGELIPSATAVRSGEEIRTVLHDGSIFSVVGESENAPPPRRSDHSAGGTGSESSE